MFDKKEYLKQLGEKLNALAPEGYDVRICDELSYKALETDTLKTILCVVKFGAASKSADDIDTINQPVTFSIISEADGHEVSMGIFTLFFKTESRASIQIGEYEGISTYFSPSLVSSFVKMKGHDYANLVTTGILTFSKKKIRGAKFYLNDEEITPLANSNIYTASPVTIQSIGNYMGASFKEGANGTANLSFYMKDTELHKKLFNYSVTGVPNDADIKYLVKYGDEIILQYDAIITAVQSAYDPITAFILLEVSIMQRDSRG